MTYIEFMVGPFMQMTLKVIGNIVVGSLIAVPAVYLFFKRF